VPEIQNHFWCFWHHCLCLDWIEWRECILSFLELHITCITIYLPCHSISAYL